jgi:hypothetical protein
MSFDKVDDDFNNDDLVNFGGRGTYSDPELEWRQTLGPTAHYILTF